MRYEKVLDVLKETNHAEEFYEKCYREYCRQNGDTIAISSAEFENFIKRNYLDQFLSLPMISYLPIEFSDESQFKDDNNCNIIVSKHNRYTPVFYHKHSFFEFVVVISGKCEHYINNTSFSMKAGDMCLIPPNVCHTISVFDESIVVNILIKKSFFRSLTFEIFDHSNNNKFSNFINLAMFSEKFENHLLIHTDNDEDILYSIFSMYNEQQNDELFSKNVLEYECIILFSKLIRKYEHTMELHSTTDTNDTFSNELMSYISSHFDTVTLALVAKHFNYSVPYASKKIKQSFGKGFNDILKNIKISKAKQLLVSSSRSVSSISDYLGYMCSDNFIKSFKKETGFTPMEYRLKNQK